MKKLLISIMVLLMALSACTAAGGTETEETAAPSTDAALQPAPTATDEPTAEPTATEVPTDTPEPTETATAVPTATEEPPTETPPAQQPTKEAPQGEGAVPEEVEVPQGAVIVFTQMGGFAGLQDTWVFYENGRTTLNGVDQAQLSPEHIADVVDRLEALGFFEISYFTKPGTVCCDFFDYTITVETAEMKNFAGYSDGDENAPANLREAGSLILTELVQEAQQR